MGCFNSNAGGGGENKPISANIQRRKIKTNEGDKQQGVHELKQNYHIDSKTKVLGVGAFGRVFLTTNKHN